MVKLNLGHSGYHRHKREKIMENNAHRVKIYTSYYANYKNIDPEYQCISISQTKPSIFIPRLIKAAPHWNLINRYKLGVLTHEQFTQAYMQQIHNTIGPDNLRDYLLQFNNDHIVLMCYEKDYTKCHRTILLSYIGFLIPELEPVGELA